jgi:MraZ protein
MQPLFLSKYINTLDKKQRVSVPAPFRSILNEQDFKGIVVYQSIRNKCIEACGMERIHKLYAMINNLDPYSEERDAFETIIFGGSSQLAFDTEGRVNIPEELVEYANLGSQICFVGKGEIFEIWNMDEFENYSKIAKEKAVLNRAILGAKI